MSDIFYHPLLIVLLVLLVLSLIILIFRKPLLGLILTIMAIPLDGKGVDTGFITLSPSNLLLLLTFFSLCLATSIRKKYIPTIPFWLIINWNIYILSALFGLRLFPFEIRIFFTLIGAFLLYLSLIGLIKNEKDLEYITIGYGVCGIIQAIISMTQLFLFYRKGITWGIYQYASLERHFYFTRVMGTHFDPNYYGIFLLPLFSIVTAILFETKSIRVRLGSIALFSLLSYGIFISYSRTAWLCGIFILIVLSILYLLQKINVSLFINRAVIIFILFIAIIIVVFAQAFRNIGFIYKLIEMNEPSFFYRYLTFREALILWSDAPIFGYGASNITALYVHNVFLQIMLRAGLFGLIPFLTLFGFAVYMASRSLVTSQRLSWLSRAIIKGYSIGLMTIILTFFLFGYEGHKMIWFICGITTAIGLNFRKLK